MQNYDAEKRNGTETATDTTSSDYVPTWREMSVIQAAGSRGGFIIDTGGYEVSPLND